MNHVSHQGSWRSEKGRDLLLPYPAEGSQLRRRSVPYEDADELESPSRPLLATSSSLGGLRNKLRLFVLLALASFVLLIVISFFRNSLPSRPTFSSLPFARPPVELSSLTWLDYTSEPAQPANWLGQRPSSPSPATSRVERSENVTLHDFLSTHFDQKNVTIFVSLVDANYAVEGLNFQLKLREFGMDNPVVLLCAEEECLDYAEKRGVFAYGGYYRRGRALFGGEALQPKEGLLPWIKFNGLLDLAREGWANVWIEGDTYLNGNPFPRMLQWDEDWDIQFTFDGLHRVNFGWMYTKPNSRSTLFWERALEGHLRNPEVWDQVIPHNLLTNATYQHHPTTPSFSQLGDLFQHEDYTVWILDFKDFRAWHLEGVKPGQPDTAIFNHLTAVWPGLRPIVAKEFGWKADVDSYYSHPPSRIITSSALTGTLSEVTRQVRILLTVAKATKRALWLPREVAPNGISSIFLSAFPAQLAAQNLTVLEGKYFEHAARYVKPTRLQQEPSERLPMIEAHTGMLELISRVNASSAFSISLEDWTESQYRTWVLSEETLGAAYDPILAEIQPCADWNRTMQWKPRYWCEVDMKTGHTGIELDMDQ